LKPRRRFAVALGDEIGKGKPRSDAPTFTDGTWIIDGAIHEDARL
jgi:hypothetical protein